MKSNSNSRALLTAHTARMRKGYMKVFILQYLIQQFKISRQLSKINKIPSSVRYAYMDVCCDLKLGATKIN